MPTLRIATWNLERPKQNGAVKNQRRLEMLRQINADLWVLTETHSAIALDGYYCLATPAQAGYHAEGESLAAIWSRWPIRRSLPTFDPYFAVCAEIDSPVGPLLVFGTVITYANDRGVDGKSRPWEEHRKSIIAHASNWQRLRAEFPDHLLCVAGDFNQSRDGSGWYEDAQSVAKLSSALEQASLRCVTELDMLAHGLSRATVDHICLPHSLATTVQALGAWEGHTKAKERMSDHNGVFVDIDSQSDGPLESRRLQLCGALCPQT